MKRSNPRNNRDRNSGFVAISRDESMDTNLDRLVVIDGNGLINEAALPRVAATSGIAVRAFSDMGTFPVPQLAIPRAPAVGQAA